MGADPPCCVMTLIIDVDASNVSSMDAMMDRFAPLVAQYRSKLMVPPSIVRSADRLRECRECGSAVKEHQCPFATGVALMSRSNSQQLQSLANNQYHQQQVPLLPSASVVAI